MPHPAETPLLDDVMRAVTAQAIVVLTAEGVLAEANDTARDLHGRPVGEPAGTWPTADLYGPPLHAGPLGPALLALTAGGTWRGAVECRHSSGRTVLTDLSVTRRPPAPGGFVLVYQPRPAGPGLLGGTSVAKLGHELRGPMNGIVGLARILLRKLSAGPGDPDTQTRQLTLLLTSAGRMLRLIEQVVDVARLQSDLVRPAPRTVDCRDVVAEAVRSKEPAARERGLRLRLESPAEPVPLLCEADLLHRVVAELIGNALRYTGGAEVRVRLSVPGAVRIEVANDGPAIPAGERTRIFEAFERGEAADGDDGGAGLGLYLARTLAGLLGADLRLRDEAGPGVTFVLDLPRGS